MIAPAPARAARTEQPPREAELLARFLEIRDNPEDACEALRLGGELAASFERLVLYVAGRKARKIPPDLAAILDRDDLKGAGREGLWRALLTYDPARGAAFANYALDMIRWEVAHEIGRLDMLKRDGRRAAKRSLEAAERLERALGRRPTDEEAAREAGIAVEKYREHRVWEERRRPWALNEIDERTLAGPEEDGPLYAEEAGEVGMIDLQDLARKLLFYAGEHAAAEALHAHRYEAEAVDEGFLMSSSHELVGGVVVLIVTETGTGRTTVVVEEMPEWAEELPDPEDEAATERRAA